MVEEIWIDRENLRLFTETIEFDCPSCSKEIVLNRRDDIGRLGPLSRYEVMCRDCKAIFYFGGDCINVPHELLWMESFKYKVRKRYTVALVLLCQAYEMMFASGIKHILVYRAFDKSYLDLDRVNLLLRRLYEVMKNHGYTNLRNCLIRLFVENIKPQTPEESLDEIRTLSSRKSDPSNDWILSNCEDTEMAQLFIDLKKSEVNVLRNDVIHCTRYFPTLEEVQDIFDESENIFPLLSYKLGLSHSRWEMSRH